MTDPSPRRRYLLCWPLSGLNDVLNRIWKAYVYAKTYDRILVVDTRRSFFKDDIGHYLRLKDPSGAVEFMPVQAFYNEILPSSRIASIHPSHIHKNDIPSAMHLRLHSINGRVHTVLSPDIIVSLSMDDDHEEDLVFYSSCGGGNGAIHVLRMITWTPLVRKVFLERRAKLPPTYAALHIRNTDKRSDGLDAFVARHHESLRTSVVFVASDDVATIRRLCQTYGDEHVQTFANIPPLTSVNIHYDHPSVPTQEFNVDTIVDVLLLASARTYDFSCPSSGYSKLANAIHRHQDLFPSMFQDDDDKDADQPAARA